MKNSILPLKNDLGSTYVIEEQQKLLLEERFLNKEDLWFGGSSIGGAMSEIGEAILTPSFSEHTLVSLEGIVNLIKEAVPVGMIYNLSRSESPDLLIVLEKSCTTAYADFENMIDLAMLGHEDGTCTIHNYGLLNAQIKNGHLFYASACVETNLIYRKNTTELFSAPDQEIISRSREKGMLMFNASLQKAVHFYEGAQYYLERNALEMVLFMLQQACELAYRCLLNVIRAKDLKCHSLTVLRKHIKRFAPEVIGAFSTVEEEELCYLQLLEEAYVKSRYQLNYSVELQSASFLATKVGILLERVKIIRLG